MKWHFSGINMANRTSSNNCVIVVLTFFDALKPFLRGLYQLLGQNCRDFGIDGRNIPDEASSSTRLAKISSFFLIFRTFMIMMETFDLLGSFQTFVISLNLHSNLHLMKTSYGRCRCFET